MPFSKPVFLFFAVVFALSGNPTFASEPTSSNIGEGTDFTQGLLVSLDYGSNKTLLGRSASVNQVYLSPAISYETQSGFFGSVAAYRLLSPKNRWDEFDLNFGWAFLLFKKKLEASVSYTRFGYGKQSTQLSAGFSNNLELIMKKNFNVVKTKLYSDYDFGNGNTDYSFTLENSHDFVFENLLSEDDVLKIRPAVSVSAGTLNFYKVHLKNSADKLSLLNPETTVETKFNFTGIELSLPLEYSIGRFSVEPAIHYNIPLNQPKRFHATDVTYFTASITFAII